MNISFKIFFNNKFYKISFWKEKPHNINLSIHYKYINKSVDDKKYIYLCKFF